MVVSVIYVYVFRELTFWKDDLPPYIANMNNAPFIMRTKVSALLRGNVIPWKEFPLPSTLGCDWFRQGNSGACTTKASG